MLVTIAMSSVSSNTGTVACLMPVVIGIDVYKRQDFKGSNVEELVGGHGQASTGCKENGNDVAQCVLSGIGPVSYTHLDVYKRQPMLLFSIDKLFIESIDY